MKEYTIKPTEHFTPCEQGDFTTVLFRGDDSLTAFLEQGGAVDPQAQTRFLLQRTDPETQRYAAGKLGVRVPKSGCSVCSVTTADGRALFGRNFDFRRCGMVILKAVPKTGYASVSTLNPDFIEIRSEQGLFDPKLEKLLKLLLYYLPMDGMNERGLCVSINNIRNQTHIHQRESGKANQTVSSLVRTLLNCAADVDEALAVLRGSNFHTMEGYQVHLAIADAAGRCVCAEYIDNQLFVTQSRVVTNHYLTPGEKYGIGTQQSHQRFQTLQTYLQEKDGQFDADNLTRAMSSVAKSNYPADGERFTEWSVIYDQHSLTASYFRREDYENRYVLSLTEDYDWGNRIIPTVITGR